jgi:excisionase family DNA binding protein
MLEKMYSKKEVAELLGVTTRTIENLMNADKLPSVLIGNRRKFKESDIQRLMDEGAKTSKKDK